MPWLFGVAHGRWCAAGRARPSDVPRRRGWRLFRMVRAASSVSASSAMRATVDIALRSLCINAPSPATHDPLPVRDPNALLAAGPAMRRRIPYRTSTRCPRQIRTLVNKQRKP